MVVAGPVTAVGYGLLARGSYTLSRGAGSSLQESVVQSDREASWQSGGSPRSGVTHREFSALHRTVAARGGGGGVVLGGSGVPDAHFNTPQGFLPFLRISNG